LAIFSKQSYIKIYTNSQATILSFHSHITSQLLSTRTKEKPDKFILWYLIQHIIEYFELQITLHKDIAYTEDFSNNAVDSLAKTNHDLSSLFPSLINTPNLSLLFTFN
ncbi:6210_t:CDS:1, partial [Funneliformis geosporum]